MIKTTLNTATRNVDLRQMLDERRRKIQHEVETRLRQGRDERSHDVSDAIDQSDADAQIELDLALLQMKSEMLMQVDAALVRLDAGEYGSCAECDGVIAERRLRALPFAVRCQGCQERREDTCAGSLSAATAFRSSRMWPLPEAMSSRSPH